MLNVYALKRTQHTHIFKEEKHKLNNRWNNRVHKENYEEKIFI